MAINKLNEKLDKIVSKEPSKWLEEAKWRLENRSWLKLSQAIAIRVLTRLDELKMSQVTLAKKMDVSPQQVNKWVKGKENFQLETICKLEDALGINLINLLSGSKNSEINTQIIQTIDYKRPSVPSEEIKQISPMETKIIPFNPYNYTREYKYNCAI